MRGIKPNKSAVDQKAIEAEAARSALFKRKARSLASTSDFAKGTNCAKIRHFARRSLYLLADCL
jgi:hypothetical protein